MPSSANPVSSIVNSNAFYLQNTFQTLFFFIFFTCSIIFSGAIVTLACSLLLAFGISFAANKFFLRRQMIVPPKSAVLITGSSTGIGLDACKRLSSLGFTVFASVRNDRDGETLRQHAPQLIIPIIMDLTNEHQVENATQIVRQTLKDKDLRLVGLVNNAGYGEYLPLEVIPLENVRHLFEVNVFGHVNVTQKFLPLLREGMEQGGSGGGFRPRIVFISSGLGRITMPGFGAYCSSKYAVESLTDAFRLELKKWNIHVSVIDPGTIETNFNKTSSILTAGTWKSIRESKTAPEVLESYVDALKKTDATDKHSQRQNVSITSDAIQAALLEQRPLESYNAGNDVACLPIILQFPKIVIDYIMGKNFR